MGADLGPALVGLGGVALGLYGGAVIEGRQHRRAHLERQRERREVALIEVLRRSSEVVGDAATVVDALSAAPRRAAVSIDLTSLDRAVVQMGQGIDEIRVLGPADLVEPLTDLFEVVVDMRDAAARGTSAEDMRARSARAHDLKQNVIAKARELRIAH